MDTSTIIPSAAVVMSALIAGVTALRASTRAAENAEFLRTHLGESNGMGTVTEMLETVITEQRALTVAAGIHDVKDTVRFRALFTAAGIPDPVPHDTPLG